MISKTADTNDWTGPGSIPVIIIGAGPAGLTAAYELHKALVRSVILEKDAVVGGIARTVYHKGYAFDIGGHRFFTKVKPVEDMWHEVLGEDFLQRKRLSRIYYAGKFFDYPLRAADALRKLGLFNGIRIVASFIKAQAFPIKPERNFEEWVVNRFGKRLYEIFFKTYTEKVWGMPCTEISAEWPAQRIKGLSLLSALRDTLIKKTDKANVIKTLIDSFHYPRKGPGMMWERVARSVTDMGSRVLMNAKTVSILWSDRVSGIRFQTGDSIDSIGGEHFISSMPIRELIRCLDPPAPEEVQAAAAQLKYRDFLTVALVLNRDVFPDNWIYIHEPAVKLGRIQNFKNWSPDMVPDPTMTCLGLEYFCFEGDGLWTMRDEDLIDLGKRELEILGIAVPADVVDGAVVRMPKAYPVYDETYKEAVDVIRRFVDGLGNLQLVGRNGMHKYNNQDHSMLTAMLAARNILGAKYDLWAVNVDEDYHEELAGDRKEFDDFKQLAVTQPRVPQRVNAANNKGGK
jgi:protoporphyrinogen oxidase